MKPPLSVILISVITALVPPVSRAATTGNSPYESKEQQFSVVTPVPFKVTTKPMGEGTDKTYVMTTYVADRGNEGFGIEVLEFPMPLETANSQVTLTNLVPAISGAVHGQIVSSANLTLDGHPGRAITATGTNASGKVQLKGRIHLSASRVYMLFVIQPVDQINDVVTDAFLDSFKLLTPPPDRAAAPPAPVEFKSAAGRFSILTPVPLTTKTQTVNSPLGLAELQNSSGYADFVSYAAGYYDLTLSPDLTPASLLQDLVKRAVDKLQAKVISQKDLSLDGHPGIEFSATAVVNNTDAALKGRFYFVDGRVYVLQFIAIQVKLNDAAADAYLQSFKLLPLPKSETPAPAQPISH